jgi:peptide/nickel transport system substrate-binding protein
MRRLRVIATGTAIAVAGLTACGSTAKPGTNAAKPGGYASNGTVTFVLPSNPGNLDPLSSAAYTNIYLAAFAYDPLVNQNPQGQLVSGLASSWKQAGTTYTFTLRKGVTCSDGSTLTASDVAANINYVAGAKSPSPLQGTAIAAGSTARADNATNTVTLTTSKPAGFVLNGLFELHIVCPNGTADRSSLSGHTDGTGPYTLTQADPGVSYTYTRRVGYTWGPAGATTAAAGMPKTIVFNVVANETTAANLLLAKQANIAEVTGPDRKRLAAAGLPQQSFQAAQGELWFNQAVGHPGASVAVRQALTMAFNAQQVGQVLSSGSGVPSTSLEVVLPTACPDMNTIGALPQFDLTQAKALLTSAGWVVGPGGTRTKDGKPLSVSLLYPSAGQGDTSDAGQLIVQEWQALGVKTTLVANTLDNVIKTVFGTTNNWDVVDLVAGGSTPSTTEGFVSGTAVTNFAHINDPTYNSLAAEANTKPGLTGCSLWKEAEEGLLRQADAVPFVNVGSPYWENGVTFTLGGIQVAPTSIRMLKS